jgi:hypothetical protein
MNKRQAKKAWKKRRAKRKLKIRSPLEYHYTDLERQNLKEFLDKYKKDIREQCCNFDAVYRFAWGGEYHE